MDMFEYMEEKNKEREAPLAARMRSQTLDTITQQTIATCTRHQIGTVERAIKMFLE